MSKFCLLAIKEQYDQALEIAHQCPQLQKLWPWKKNSTDRNYLSYHWDDLIQLGTAEFQAELKLA